MLRPRIIPSLLIHNNGLVKTVNFSNPKYIGDPINAVKIFNDKGADELTIFDIDATVLKKEPNYSLLENIASQSMMPLCYGGGVKSVEQAKRIFNLGIEKIAISSAVLEDTSLISNIAQHVGSQSVVVVLDLKRTILGGYGIYTLNGKKRININPFDFVEKLHNLGAGELVVNSIHCDGVMKGFDLELIRKIREKTNLPLTVLGGAGSLDDFKKVVSEHGIIGVAAGSFFIFKGPHKAVLLSYLNFEEKKMLFY